MASTENASAGNGSLVRGGLVGLLLIAAAGAFLGMGLFMFNMGNDMATMTRAVTQMGRDVNSMARDMEQMTGRMQVMADSMVEGQAGMSEDLHHFMLHRAASASAGKRATHRVDFPPLVSVSQHRNVAGIVGVQASLVVGEAVSRGLGEPPVRSEYLCTTCC